MKYKHFYKVVSGTIAGVGVIAATSAITGHYFHVHPVPQPYPLVELTSQKFGPPDIYPNPELTPGMTNPDINQSNISQNICNPQWSTKSIRPPASYTSALKIKQLKNDYDYQNYVEKITKPSGIKWSSDYEEDHFIPLELGGNPSDPKNLWPQSYLTKVNGIVVGAKQKDTVENKLHSEVCNNQITLDRAQQIITKDWYACFLLLSSGNPCI